MKNLSIFNWSDLRANLFYQSGGPWSGQRSLLNYWRIPAEILAAVLVVYDATHLTQNEGKPTSLSHANPSYSYSLFLFLFLWLTVLRTFLPLLILLPVFFSLWILFAFIIQFSGFCRFLLFLQLFIIKVFNGSQCRCSSLFPSVKLIIIVSPQLPSP